MSPPKGAKVSHQDKSIKKVNHVSPCLTKEGAREGVAVSPRRQGCVGMCCALPYPCGQADPPESEVKI